MKLPRYTILKLMLLIVLVACILLPLARMIAYIRPDDMSRVFNSAQFVTALRNSVTVSAAATLVSLVLAGALAYCMTRTNMPFKGLFGVALILPMLIPSISHSTGLIILFGTNGVLTRLLHLSGSIYGFRGILCGSTMYAFPIAFLMIADILRYEDYLPYEAAIVLGVDKRHRFAALSIPYLRRPMIAVVFSIFTMIFTDYGVPLTIGGKFTTLPVILYEEVIGQLNFGKGSVIGVLLLIPALIAFVLDIANRDHSNMSYITAPFRIGVNRARDALALALCALVSLFIFTTIAAFALLAFARRYPIDLSATLDNVLRTFNMGGARYLGNSLLISVLVSALGTAVCFGYAYCTARMRSPLTRGLHLLFNTSLAIPGIVLGLSYVLAFKGSFLYGTILILILVNLVHFGTSPYLMMYNTLSKVNENLEAVGQTLGVSRIRIVLDVLVPQTRATLLEMASYLFFNSMITISAVSFLATTQTKPFSLMINQFDALMITECSAVVSLILLAVNALVKGGAYLLKRRIARREQMVKA